MANALADLYQWRPIDSGNYGNALASLGMAGLNPDNADTGASDAGPGAGPDLGRYAGYKLGQYIENGQVKTAIMDPNGNVLGQYGWTQPHHSMTGSDYATAASVVGGVLGAGYGAAALGAEGGTAALGANQVGALTAPEAIGAGGEIAGSGMTASAGTGGLSSGLTAGSSSGLGMSAAGTTAGGTAAGLGSTGLGTTGLGAGTAAATAAGSGGMDWSTIAGQLGSTALQSFFANKAAGSQSDATQAAIAEQQRQFNINQQNMQPWLQAGTQALGQYQGELNKPTTAADVMQDPGYQFGLQQGQQALDRKAAAAGGRLSGASLKAAQQYGTDYATTGYGAAYQRNQDRLSRLAALAGLGNTTATNMSSNGTQTANSLSGLIQNQGNQAGAAQLAQGNIWGNGINQAIAQYAKQPVNTNPNGVTPG